MKTTLKKTMAALSAAAVVAASAAVMAIPASADVAVSAGTVTLTLSELKAANYEVTVPITSDADLGSIDFGMKLSDGLTYVDAGTNTKASCTPAEVDGFVWMPWAFGGVKAENIAAGEIAYLTVKVTESAEAGSEYPITLTNENAKGVHTSAGQYVDGKLQNAEFTPVAGAIIITEDPTEAPTTTTAAPETTAAPATTAATTAKVATATTKKATSTSSPKTGDALPVAGVAVAVAVIGGVALVSKKRK